LTRASENEYGPAPVIPEYTAAEGDRRIPHGDKGRVVPVDRPYPGQDFRLGRVQGTGEVPRRNVDQSPDGRSSARISTVRVRPVARVFRITGNGRVFWNR